MTSLSMAMLREMAILSSVKYPNILRLVAYCTDKGGDRMCTLCELDQLGSLRKALLDTAMALKMTCWIRIRIALSYLHCYIPGHPVFHEDKKISCYLTASEPKCRLRTRALSCWAFQGTCVQPTFETATMMCSRRYTVWALCSSRS